MTKIDKSTIPQTPKVPDGVVPISLGFGFRCLGCQETYTTVEEANACMEEHHMQRFPMPGVYVDRSGDLFAGLSYLQTRTDTCYQGLLFRHGNFLADKCVMTLEKLAKRYIPIGTIAKTQLILPSEFPSHVQLLVDEGYHEKRLMGLSSDRLVLDSGLHIVLPDREFTIGAIQFLWYSADRDLMVFNYFDLERILLYSRQKPRFKNGAKFRNKSGEIEIKVSSFNHPRFDTAGNLYYHIEDRNPRDLYCDGIPEADLENYWEIVE